ncbi:MAG: FHIPEP family type III secretion protein [Nannocystis sp.]|uniref:FHIPEP family type III secretion protein n=1 Tax=Nannocystis sp. TaxID=1962667 RepID=UPI0024264955|nr:FHIPEP family type III secretion protein [Nannocystis sp.]MBK9756354.1 FHIPEP family type III secretion protein [Nannocystis sp.]
MTDDRVSSLALLRRATSGWPRLLPAAWVCVMLACLLVPLPTVAVDLLLSLSLAGSMLLLVASLAVRRRAELLAFPSLLLLLTLSRLALNVATTRLILSQADAGRVIDAFAGLVVRGDIVVGAVMFAVITAVQFLVIARGSERVAEVAARFALDGLPGQQAAIDADLRAGAISPEEAARRRHALLQRSDFHGAMDGAVRFVRGDAIAGLAITIINLVGGIAVGTLRRGMDVGASLELYGRLTVGDGLLAQIPALLVSLAAGVLVTRVDEEATRRPRALAWLEPAMLAVPAALLTGLALVPGMPRLAFLATATGLVCAGLWLAARAPEEAPEEPALVIELRLVGAGPEALRVLRPPLAALRRRCAAALAIELPPIVAVALPGELGGVEVRLGVRVLATLGPAELAVLVGPPGQGKEDMSFGPGSLGPGSEPSGLVVDALVVVCFRAVMNHAEAFYDLRQLEGALERSRRRDPAAVREALRVTPAGELLALCRGLLRERLPLPPLAELLDAVASEPRLRSASERGRWGELLRERLAGLWVHDLVAAHARLGPLRWVRPLPDVEAELLQRTRTGEGGLALALAPGERAAWLASLRDGHTEPPIVVTTPAARPAFAALVHRSAPQVAVISTAELQAVELMLPGEPGGPPVRWWQPG